MNPNIPQAVVVLFVKYEESLSPQMIFSVPVATSFLGGQISWTLSAKNGKAELLVPGWTCYLRSQKKEILLLGHGAGVEPVEAFHDALGSAEKFAKGDPGMLAFVEEARVAWPKEAPQQPQESPEAPSSASE